MRGKNAFKFWSVIIATTILVILALNGLSLGNGIGIKSAKDIRTGIDITGGVSAALEPAAGSDLSNLKKDLATVKALIEHRLDRIGILDKFVSIDEQHGRVIVEIPWKQGDADRNPQKLIEDSITTAKLYFQEVKLASGVVPTTNPTSAPLATTKPGSKVTVKPTAAPTSVPTPASSVTGTLAPNTTALPTGNVAPTSDPNQIFMNDGAPYVKVGTKPILEGIDISNATSEYDATNGNFVSLKFTNAGAAKFSTATASLATHSGLLGIFMDDDLISAPKVDKQIAGDAIITGKFTARQTGDLADKIRSGNLPFSLVVKQIDVISSQLGQQAFLVTIYALLIALILIILFMLIYYRLPGLLAGVALITHTALQLLFISNTGITVTLPGMAGIILSIGLAVDANVIIFERIKEELRGGKTLRASVEAGFKRGFTAVLDGNVTAIIAAAVLWYFGTGAIQSFAITTLIGVALSFLTAVTFSRWMLQATSDWDIATHPWLWGGKKTKETVEEKEVAK